MTAAVRCVLLQYCFAPSAWGPPLLQRQFANRAFTPLPLMKIHTKHLALCEKGGKFNKTHNTIYKLQEELIEPTGTIGGVSFIFIWFFFSFLILANIRKRCPSCGGWGRGRPKRSSRNLLSLAKMQFGPVFFIHSAFSRRLLVMPPEMSPLRYTPN